MNSLCGTTFGPRPATAPVPAPRGSARAARRRGRGGAARSPVCPSPRRGFPDFNSVSSDFNALRGGKFSFRPRARSCGSRPERTVSRAPVYQIVWLGASEPIPFPGADSIFSSRCGAISGRGRLTVSARNLSSGLGLTWKQEKSESAATANPPACGATRRDARVRRRAQALLGGGTSLTVWPWGYRVGETMKNPSTSCVYQKEKSTFSLHRKRRPRGSARALDTPPRNPQVRFDCARKGKRSHWPSLDAARPFLESTEWLSRRSHPDNRRSPGCA